MNETESKAKRLKDCEALMSRYGARVFVGDIILPKTYPAKAVRIRIPHKAGIPAPRPLTIATTCATSLQYFGIHKHLVVTLQRPTTCDNLIRMGQLAPTVYPHGQISWLGSCIFRHYSIDPSDNTWLIYFFKNEWRLNSNLFKANTKMTLTVLHYSYPISARLLSGQPIQLLEFPALGMEFFDVPQRIANDYRTN